MEFYEQYLQTSKKLTLLLTAKDYGFLKEKVKEYIHGLAKEDFSTQEKDNLKNELEQLLVKVENIEGIAKTTVDFSNVDSDDDCTNKLNKMEERVKLYEDQAKFIADELHNGEFLLQDISDCLKVIEKCPKNLSHNLQERLQTIYKKLDPLAEIEPTLEVLQLKLDKFDGDRNSLDFLYLDQSLLDLVQSIKKSKNNERKKIYLQTTTSLRKILYEKIQQLDADYDKKMTMRLEKILGILTDTDAELVGPLDEAKRTYLENVLIDMIKEVDSVDSTEHPNLLEEKRAAISKIQEQQKKLENSIIDVDNRNEACTRF